MRTRPSVRRLGQALIFLLCLAAPPLAAEEGSEFALKAAFAYNFALYAEWPTPPAIFEFCALGDDDRLASALDRLSSRQIAGRGIAVRRAAADDLASCNVVIIPAGEHRRLKRIRNSLGSSAVLTIGDAALDPGSVMIRFVKDADRLAFEVNLGLAREAGLTFSSKLLRLARTLH